MLIELKGCSACTLRHEWKYLKSPKMPIAEPASRSFGLPVTRVMFVGEAPGATEDEKGLPFVGDSGQFLRDAMPKAWRENVYWTNVCRCRPPKNRTPTDSEATACVSGFLVGGIDRFKPHVIVAVGDTALSAFLPGHTVTNLRGIPIPIDVAGAHNCWLYPLWHPSYVMRSGSPKNPPGDDKFNVIYPVWKSDIDRLFRFEWGVDYPAIPPMPVIFTPNTLEHAKALYGGFKSTPAIDFETSKLKPYLREAKLLTAALSDGISTFAFPIQWPGVQNSWGMEFLNYIMSKERKFGWIAHQAGMELIWSWYHTGKAETPFYDTMCKQKFIFNRAAPAHGKGLASLDVQTLIYLGTKIKDATDTELTRALRRPGEHILNFPIEEVLKYNGYDAWATKLVDQRQVLPKDQEENYARSLRTTRSCVRMELLGLDIDFLEVHHLKVELAKQLDVIEEKIRGYEEVKDYEEDTNTTLRLSAPQDIATVLVKYSGVPLRELSPGKWSTDDAELEKYSDYELIRDIQDHREVAKLKSTYVDPIIVGEYLGSDSKLHSSYKPVHTATGRLASEDPNIQNFPKRKHREIRKMIVAPKGHLFVSGDYGQLEARALAMLSRDQVLRRSIINKEDIHSKWLNKAIDAYPSYLDRLARKTGEGDEGQIRKAARDIIKTDFVFASFYGAIAKTVATRTQIPIDLVNALWAEFWDEHEGVLEWQKKVKHDYWKTGTVETLQGLKRNEILPGNETINTPTQGSGALIVLEAQNALSEMGDIDIVVAPRINIHDDLTFFIPDDNDAEGYIELCAEEMVKPRHDYITCPLMVEMKVGYDWMNLDVVGKFEGKYFD